MYYYDNKHHKKQKRHSAQEGFILVFMFVLVLISAGIPFLFA